MNNKIFTEEMHGKPVDENGWYDYNGEEVFIVAGAVIYAGAVIVKGAVIGTRPDGE